VVIYIDVSVSIAWDFPTLSLRCEMALPPLKFKVPAYKVGGLQLARLSTCTAAEPRRLGVEDGRYIRDRPLQDVAGKFVSVIVGLTAAPIVSTSAFAKSGV
jgi:hypothetical protein